MANEEKMQLGADLDIGLKDGGKGLTSDLETLYKKLATLEEKLSKERKKTVKGQLSEEIKETKKAIKTIEQDYKKHLGSITEQAKKNWNDRVALAKQKAKEAAEAEKKYAKESAATQKSEMSRLLALARKNVAERKKLAREQAAAEAKANAFGNRVSRVVSTIGLYATGGASIYGTINVIKETIMEALNLEKALSKVNAITKATSEQIGVLSTNIRVTAAEIGKSIDDVAKYTIAMSKLGLSVSEVTQITEPVAALSAVLGEDLAETGQLVVTTLKQFNLQVSEASYVSSVFFNAVKNSPLDINQLNTAMQYVGSSAEAVGVTLKEAGDMMVLLSNRGLKASKIGTGLRNVFVKLKEDGNNVIDVLRDMNESGLQFSEAVDLFGKRGAIVGYNLVANFKELEEMFVKDLPTAMDNIVAKTVATDNVIDKFGRLWSGIKAEISGASEAASEIWSNEHLRDMVLYISELKNADDTFDKLNEFAKYGNRNGFYELISQVLPEGTSHWKRNAEAAKILYEQLKNIYDLQREAEIGRTAGYYSLAGINLSPKSIAEQDEAIKNVEKIIAEEKERRKNTVPYLRTSEAEFKAYISYLEAELNKLKQINVMSESEAWEIVRNNSELYKNMERYKTSKSNGDLISLKAKIDEADERTKEAIELLCALNPSLLLCDKFKQKKTKTKEPDILETTSLLDFGGDSGKTKINYSKGDWGNVAEGAVGRMLSGSSPENESIFISDYYRNLIDEIEQQEADALLDLDKKREQEAARHSSLLEILYSKQAAETTEKGKQAVQSEIADEIERNKDLLADFEDEQVDIVDGANEAKLQSYEDFVKAIKKLMKEFYDEEENNQKEEKRKQEELWKEIAKWAKEAIKTLADIYNTYESARLENKLDYIDAEIEAVRRRADVESDILQSQFDNDIITAEGYAKKRTELEKKRIDEENRLNKAAFEAQKRADINAAKANGVAQAAQAFIQGFISGGGYPYGLIVGGAAAALVGVKAAAEVDAIKQRKFYPVKYADGGEVIGRSHAEGGVPFSVSGQGGYEMEGGEFIVNKDATAKYKPLLEAINGKNKMYSDTKFFADGGMVQDVRIKDSQMNQQLIRAYITKRDLRDYEKEERNIKSISKI